MRLSALNKSAEELSFPFEGNRRRPGVWKHPQSTSCHNSQPEVGFAPHDLHHGKLALANTCGDHALHELLQCMSRVGRGGWGVGHATHSLA